MLILLNPFYNLLLVERQSGICYAKGYYYGIIMHELGSIFFVVSMTPPMLYLTSVHLDKIRFCKFKREEDFGARGKTSRTLPVNKETPDKPDALH